MTDEGRRAEAAEPGERGPNYAIYFTPGMLVGLVIGYFTIKPVNVVLGALFRGFNRVFDRLTDVYGWVIGKGLRLAAIVVLAYAGLVFLTYVVFRDSPRGFVPQQDMGRIMVSVHRLPDFPAGLHRTQGEVIDQVDRDHSPRSRRRPHDRPVRHLIRRTSQRVQLRLVFRHS